MNCNQFTPDISATSAAAGEAAAEGRRKINPKDSERICNHQHCWNTCHLICGNMTMVAWQTCSGAMLGMRWYRDPWGVELKMAGCHALTARHCEWRQIDEPPAALSTGLAMVTTAHWLQCVTVHAGCMSCIGLVFFVGMLDGESKNYKRCQASVIPWPASTSLEQQMQFPCSFWSFFRHEIIASYFHGGFNQILGRSLAAGNA